jgi:hypothetical protein
MISAGKATGTGTLTRATRRQLGAGEVDFDSCGGVCDACFDGPGEETRKMQDGRNSSHSELNHPYSARY